VLTMVLQIGAALYLERAAPRLVVKSIASLALLPLDAVVSVLGTWSGLRRQRVEWTTEHRT
jgi:hypothetical protein